MTQGVSGVVVNRVSRYMSLSLLIFCCCWLLLRLLRDISWGGNAWKQGDWLINSLLEPVRRGPMGSALLEISDLSGLPPLYVVGLVQAVLTIVIFAALVWLCLRSREPDLFLLSISSSAMVVMFWAADPQGSMRKEMFSIAALAWIAVGISDRRTAPLLIGTLVFCLGPWGHEVNLFLIPAYIGLLVIWVWAGGSKPLAAAMIALVCVNGLAALFYAYSYLSPQDVAHICEPLLMRGVDSNLCGGAITWLGYEDATGSARIAETFFHVGTLPKQVFLMILAFAPWVYILTISSEKRSLVLWALVLLLPIAPLFFVAVDWGRWMSLYFFSIFVLYTAAINLGSVRLVRPVQPIYLVGFLLLGLLITPDHIEGIHWGGVIRNTLQDVMDFLT